MKKAMVSIGLFFCALIVFAYQPAMAEMSRRVMLPNGIYCQVSADVVLDKPLPMARYICTRKNISKQALQEALHEIAIPIWDISIAKEYAGFIYDNATFPRQVPIWGKRSSNMVFESQCNILLDALWQTDYQLVTALSLKELWEYANISNQRLRYDAFSDFCAIMRYPEEEKGMLYLYQQSIEGYPVFFSMRSGEHAPLYAALMFNEDGHIVNGYIPFSWVWEKTESVTETLLSAEEAVSMVVERLLNELKEAAVYTLDEFPSQCIFDWTLEINMVEAGFQVQQDGVAQPGWIVNTSFKRYDELEQQAWINDAWYFVDAGGKGIYF